MDPIAIEKDGAILDLQTAKVKNIDIESAKKIYPENSPEALEVIRHSTAHLMAQAIKELYPDAKFFVGPVVDEGFYYDFRTNEKISEEDLPKIEKKMQEIARRKLDITRYEVPKSQAIEKFKEDDLKQEVLKSIPSDMVSIYKQGDFEDLCRGPHVPNTKYLKHFKLTRVAGAYLGGDETKEMLTRIYGVAFADKKSLKDYLTMIEEAKKRDHRKLGAEMELFMFSEEVGAGLPIWLAKGARLRSKLESLLFNAHRKRGYEPVRGPEILKSDLWKKSGHYQNYKENMYFTEICDDERKESCVEYGIKPMNCVGHIMIYKSKKRSYRELPLKFFEYGVVHRHEKSGVLHGLFRVREFTQDDAHIFCKPEQIKDIVIEVLGFVDEIMRSFNFQYEMEISTKPKKAIGDDAIWEVATKALKEALDENGHEYGIDEGGGAFYGPKIDIKITDAIGRKWQCGTIQVDFNLPERFELEFVDSDNSAKRPVMIHRAILGSFERFIGILIEHYAGEFPFFIAPTQIIFVPIADSHVAYAKELQAKLLEMGVDSEIYDSKDSLNKRIRNAEKQKVPMVAIIGDKEVESKSVAIRDRREKTQYNISESEFFTKIKEKLSEVRF
ncbi:MULTISPECIES: threonine--tRNA ligase [unclassified Nitratiruptor]|uniref:threonine--tRNA ligase n=1 Tax=unclassified Nitratiruptor TaxID=2624044 RepID=UPI001916155D|nr:MULTISPECIES: threonine--tRNA ligase [unclassified Nitratiruptor]BCD59382.1 threonyl-tRNA synthetase [Nitratiruptor sp. YY08-10]BCD63306.1 threonyl-tRNA synthetase [Nitratiruptor sp. YY08-14]